MKRGLYLAPFDELADPRLLVELARVAESRGWDGLFLWDRSWLVIAPMDICVNSRKTPGPRQGRDSSPFVLMVGVGRASLLLAGRDRGPGAER